jgi:hypothetical protein
VVRDVGAVEKLLHERTSMELPAFVRIATAAIASRRPANGLSRRGSLSGMLGGRAERATHALGGGKTRR